MGIAGVVRQHFSVTVLFGVHAALVAVAWAVISLKMPARVPAKEAGNRPLSKEKEKEKEKKNVSPGPFLHISISKSLGT